VVGHAGQIAVGEDSPVGCSPSFGRSVLPAPVRVRIKKSGPCRCTRNAGGQLPGSGALPLGYSSLARAHRHSPANNVFGRGRSHQAPRRGRDNARCPSNAPAQGGRRVRPPRMPSPATRAVVSFRGFPPLWRGLPVVLARLVPGLRARRVDDARDVTALLANRRHGRRTDGPGGSGGGAGAWWRPCSGEPGGLGGGAEAGPGAAQAGAWCAEPG
jgi:hypothetical protein